MPAAPNGSTLGRGAAALAIAAFVASVAIGGAQNKDVLRACVGGLAFLAGAAGAFDPRRAPVVFAFIGIVGLAMVGIGPGTSGQTLTLEVGIGLAMGGVLGLGGSIHRLGRLGPA